MEEKSMPAPIDLHLMARIADHVWVEVPADLDAYSQIFNPTILDAIEFAAVLVLLPAAVKSDASYPLEIPIVFTDDAAASHRAPVRAWPIQHSHVDIVGTRVDECYAVSLQALMLECVSTGWMAKPDRP
jgi:hypothetical protein